MKLVGVVAVRKSLIQLLPAFVHGLLYFISSRVNIHLILISTFQIRSIKAALGKGSVQDLGLFLFSPQGCDCILSRKITDTD